MQRSFRSTIAVTKSDIALPRIWADRKCEEPLERLIPLIESEPDRPNLDLCLGHNRNARKSLDDLPVGEPSKTPIHPQYVAKMLDELAAEDRGADGKLSALSSSFTGAIVGPFWVDTTGHYDNTYEAQGTLTKILGVHSLKPGAGLISSTTAGCGAV